MDQAFRRAYARRGAIYWLPKVEFPDITKAKYLVLLEDYNEGMVDLVVAFTTSRTEFSYRKTNVLVKDGTINGMDGDTSIELNNNRLIPSERILLDDRTRYLDTLPPSIMKEIDEGLLYVSNTDEETLIRMLK